MSVEKAVEAAQAPEAARSASTVAVENLALDQHFGYRPLAVLVGAERSSARKPPVISAGTLLAVQSAAGNRAATRVVARCAGACRCGGNCKGRDESLLDDELGRRLNLASTPRQLVSRQAQCSSVDSLDEPSGFSEALREAIAVRGRVGRGGPPAQPRLDRYPEGVETRSSATVQRISPQRSEARRLNRVPTYDPHPAWAQKDPAQPAEDCVPFATQQEAAQVWHAWEALFRRRRRISVRTAHRTLRTCGTRISLGLASPNFTGPRTRTD
jgi:hypothetical protein